VSVDLFFLHGSVELVPVLNIFFFIRL